MFCEVWIDIILVSLERPKIHVTLKKGTVFLGIFQENWHNSLVYVSYYQKQKFVFGEPLTNNKPGAIITVVAFRLSSGDRMQNEQAKDSAREILCDQYSWLNEFCTFSFLAYYTFPSPPLFSVALFCMSSLPLYFLYFSRYISVSLFICSFSSLVSFVILHSFRSSICVCLYLSVFVSLFLSSPSFLPAYKSLHLYSFFFHFLAIQILLFLLHFSFLLPIYFTYFWFLLSVILLHSFCIWQRLLPII